LCGLNEKVLNHVCTECPSGKTSTGNHDASGSNTTCDATMCGPNEKVVNHACMACPAGKTSTGDHDASGPNTTCDATMCGPNEKVVNHVCTECPSGRTSTGSHDASGLDTSCVADYHWAADGAPANRKGGHQEDECEPNIASAAGVRCCDHDANTCDSYCPGVQIKTQRQSMELGFKTYQEAVSACSSLGLRLCTRSELATNVCRGTGCYFDTTRVWTSDVCVPATGGRRLKISSMNAVPTAASLANRTAASIII